MESKFVPLKKNTIWAAIILIAGNYIAADIANKGANVFQSTPFIILLSFTILVLIAWGVEEALRR